MRKVLAVTMLVLLSCFCAAQAADIGISLVSPSFGVDNKDIFDLKIQTNVSCVLCKYSNSPDIAYGDIHSHSNFFTRMQNGYVHQIDDFPDLQGTDNYEKTIYIKCNTTQGQVNEDNPANFTLMVDSTAPVISDAYTVPELVIEKIEATLVVVTGDKTKCKYDPERSTYSTMRYKFNGFDENIFGYVNNVTLTQSTIPSIHDGNSYSYYAACMNRAENISSYASVSFSVNLSTPNKIIFLAPSGYLSNTSTKLRVDTNKDATCYYGENYANQFPQINEKKHSMEVANLEEKEHSIPVKCVYALGGMDGFSQITFTVDLTEPRNLVIETDSYVCENDELSAEFDAEDEGGILKYEYKIVDSSGNVIVDWKHGDNREKEKGLDLIYDREYFWVVRAIDRAGNIGPEVKSNGTFVYGENNTNCRRKTPPLPRVMTNVTFSGTKIDLECIDYDGQCTAKRYCLVYNATDCGGCAYNPFYPMTITKDALFCYEVEDNDGNIVPGSKFIKYEKAQCLSSYDNCCNSQSDGICDPDCSSYMDSDCAQPNQTTTTYRYRLTTTTVGEIKELEDDHTLSYVLLTFGTISLLGGVAYLIMKKPAAKPAAKAKQFMPSSKPALQREILSSKEVKSSDAKKKSPEQLQKAIIEKRKSLKRKQREDVFSSFDRLGLQEETKQMPMVEDAGAEDEFRKLDEISDQPFWKLSRLKKFFKGKKIDDIGKNKDSKDIDKLIRK